MRLGDRMGGGVTRSMDEGTLGVWGGEVVLDGVLYLLLLQLVLKCVLLGRDLKFHVEETELGDWRLQQKFEGLLMEED